MAKCGTQTKSYKKWQDALVVAAIDFGTTYSGFAFALKKEYPEVNIQVKNWNDDNKVRCLESHKAPTTLLLDQDEEFVAFGYKAEQMYTDLANNNQHHGWRYFKQFKMNLHNCQKLQYDTEIFDDQNRGLLAITVFSHCIRFLKNDLLRMLDDKNITVKDGEIVWVLTVPAIWDDASKQFMREAAKDAGLCCENLMLALEPEAASVFIKEMKIQKNLREDQSAFLAPYSVGTKYMILDMGGGTVDVTVREVMTDRSLKEVTIASGGAWGGIKVNEKFEEFIEEIIGKDVMKEMRKTYVSEALELEKEIEQKKRNLQSDGKKRVLLRLPAVALELFEKMRNMSLEDFLQSSNRYKSMVELKCDKLKMDFRKVSEFFSPSVTSIIDHIEGILSSPQVEGLSDIIVVGGFADSKIMAAALKARFEHRVSNIITPTEAGLVVLKGAVLYGCSPDVVSHRISKYTYGTNQHRFFLEGEDPEDLKDVINGVPYCGRVFNRFAHAGESFKIGQTIEFQVFPIHENMTKMPVYFYTTSDENPKYVGGQCREIGKLMVDMPDTADGLDRMVTVYLTFGETELQAEGLDHSSGEKVSVSFEWLGTRSTA